MTRRYQKKTANFDLGVLAALFEAPDPASPQQPIPGGGFFIKIADPGENDDWVRVEDHGFEGDPAPRSGWTQAWALGPSIPDEDQFLSAVALTFGAVRRELELASDEDRPTLAAEYLIALALVENGVATTGLVFDDDLAFKIRSDRPDPDAVGPYAVTSKEWDAFIAGPGAGLGWAGGSVRHLGLPQQRAIAALTIGDWKALSKIAGAPPAEAIVPRFLDFFVARMIGVRAAADLSEREAKGGASLTKKMDNLLRDANGWLSTAPELKDTLRDRADLLLDGGAAVEARVFLQRCRERLDPALAAARGMINAYIPGFVVAPPTGAAGWMDHARTELADWKGGNWVESAGDGKDRATGYFKATDYGPAVVVGADGELTHWCGAFAAFCVEKAGLEPPKGAAAAASWVEWGDVSLPKTPGADIPPGAVVTISGGANTNRIGHVCLFVQWKDGKLMGLGGNQTDKVSIAPFAPERIHAIRMIGDKAAGSDADDLEVLARTLYGEIRGGSEAQIRNVAHVILNRFETGYRANGSIKGACLAPMQFSCWNPGTDSLTTLQNLPTSNPELSKLRNIASTVIDERKSGAAPPFDSLVRHYHNHFVNPNWADAARVVLDDGKHIFYRAIA